MYIIHLELSQANAFVERLHRHHGKVAGHRFSIAAIDSGNLIGVAICGRPVARAFDQARVIEITRLATDGTKNACSFLYSAAARVAREMGFETIITYILESETGTSLKASGFKFDGVTDGGRWSRSGRHRGDDHPICPKQRWVKQLCAPRGL